MNMGIRLTIAKTRSSSGNGLDGGDQYCGGYILRKGLERYIRGTSSALQRSLAGILIMGAQKSLCGLLANIHFDKSVMNVVFEWSIRVGVL